MKKKIVIGVCALFLVFVFVASHQQPNPRDNKGTQSTSVSENVSDVFSNPQRVVIEGYKGTAMEPFISRDGQYLFFNNNNNQKPNTNLYYAKMVNDTTFTFQGEVGGVNTPSLEAVASMDTAGNFYFITTKSYDQNRMTLYHAVFSGGGLSGVAPVEGISRNQPGLLNMDAEINLAGDALYYADNPFTGGDAPKVSNIEVATKNADGSFTKLSNSSELVKNINNGDLNYAPSISQNGLELFFTRAKAGSVRVYVARRNSTSEPFGISQLVAAADGFVEGPTLSSDGTHLYYHKKVGGGAYAIYVVTRKK